MADAKPQCRLYLQVPIPSTAKLDAQLAQTLKTTSAACVLLCNNGPQSDTGAADGLIDLVQGAGLACLIEDDIDRAEQLGADGVHIAAHIAAHGALADGALYAQARGLLGESANIGVACGDARHAAMQLAEAGADYVAFGPESGMSEPGDSYEELIAWWSEIFVVPCVAWNVGTPSGAERFARAGADFVAPPRTIWQSDDCAAMIADIDSAIRRVRTAA